MSWFTWNPHWFSPGDSLWSVAAKIAYVTTCAVSTVLKALVNVSERHRLGIWAPGALERIAVANQLELTPATVDTMFLGDGPRGLEARSDISLQVRWCPVCSQTWHHHVRFQDRRVLRCPWHDAVLCEGCLKCGRAIDPMGVPWRCGHCHAALAPEPIDWLRLFRQPGQAAWPPTLQMSHVAYEVCKGRVVCHGDNTGRLNFEDRPWALKFWQHAQLYEAGTALWDSVLHDHRVCAAEERESRATQYYVRQFRCPVPGARWPAPRYQCSMPCPDALSLLVNGLKAPCPWAPIRACPLWTKFRSK